MYKCVSCFKYNNKIILYLFGVLVEIIDKVICIGNSQ